MQNECDSTIQLNAIRQYVKDNNKFPYTQLCDNATREKYGIKFGSAADFAH